MTESIINNTDDTHPADLVQEATQLHSLVVTFRTSLSEWRERIEHAIEWHALSSEVRQQLLLTWLTFSCGIAHSRTCLHVPV